MCTVFLLTQVYPSPQKLALSWMYEGFLLVIFHLDKPKPSVDFVDGWPFSLIFSLSCP